MWQPWQEAWYKAAPSCCTKRGPFDISRDAASSALADCSAIGRQRTLIATMPASRIDIGCMVAKSSSAHARSTLRLPPATARQNDLSRVSS